MGLLKQELIDSLKSLGIKDLTAPQIKTIPQIIKGEDVLVCAPTGFGKTLAAVIPVFNKIMDSKEQGIKAIYITPLKALNRDVHKRVLELGNLVGLKVEIRHGDTTKNERRRQANKPADFLITTPESLQSILTGSRMRENLKTIQAVIIDELHELVNDKRGSQLSVGIERLKALKGGEVQLIGLSATINNKKEVAEYLSSKCKVISTDVKKDYDIRILKAKVREEDKELSRRLYISPEVAFMINELIKYTNKFKSIIFVNTRETAEMLSSRLAMMGCKDIGVHHGSLSKEERVKMEDEFKNSALRGIIATSSLELGIDVGDVELVIQFQSPRQANKLIQRVGRAGHKAGKVSRGLILTRDEDDYIEARAVLNKAESKWVEQSVFYHKPLDVLTHQIIGVAMDFEKPTKEYAYELITKARPYKHLRINEYEQAFDILCRNKLIFINEDGTYNRGVKGLKHYYMNLSTIPNVKSYRITNIESNQVIGKLSEDFIARNTAGSVFICRGKPWEVLSIEGDEVLVCSSTDYDSAIPSWEGELIPIHYEIANEVRMMLKDERALESYNNNVVLKTYFGSQVNETISQVMNHVIKEKHDINVKSSVNPYMIVFTFENESKNQIVEEVLNEITSNWILPLLYNSVKKTNAYLYRLSNVSKRIGILQKNKNYNAGLMNKILKEYENTVLTKEALKEMLIERVDLELTEELIGLINKGKLKMKPASSNTVTQLERGFRDFSAEKSDPKLMVKTRLENTKFIYYCLSCGKYVGKLKCSEARNLKCSCKSKRLTFFKDNDEERTIVLGKHLRKEGLSKEEEKKYEDLEKRADMFINYSYMAPLTISARGVGVRTALRILQGNYKTEDDYLKRIIDEEKTFTKNKRFWCHKK